MNKLKEESVQNGFPLQSVEAKVKRLVDCAKEILGEGLEEKPGDEGRFAVYTLGLSEFDRLRVEEIMGQKPVVLRSGEPGSSFRDRL
ncbi:hypothetical protein GC167_05135 [bacterium]|nr:hypothetical protein [bacterium]